MLARVRPLECACIILAIYSKNSTCRFTHNVASARAEYHYESVRGKRGALATAQLHAAGDHEQVKQRPAPSTIGNPRRFKHHVPAHKDNSSAEMRTPSRACLSATVPRSATARRGGLSLSRLAAPPSAWRRHLNVPCPNRGFVGSGGQLHAQAAVCVL